jgi:transforming growth factor-beta-induced protein
LIGCCKIRSDSNKKDPLLDPTGRLFVLGHKASPLPSSLHKPKFREVIIFRDSSYFVVIAQVVDIVQTAINNGNFTTLVTALTEADLVTTLQGPGPFTVFAPNDVAFNKLPVGVVGELIKPENNETLSRILLYHVTNGTLTATNIEALGLPVNVTMLAGGYVTVSENGTSLKVNDAAVIAPDVFATNGIIHVLDSVLLPPLDIVETAIVSGNFKTLVAALQAADLVATLKGTGPFTVFAPTDAAFSKLPNGTVEDLLQPENVGKLADILKYHVLGQSVTSADINNMTLPAQVVTLSGTGLRAIVDKNGTDVKVNAATVTVADVSSTNGIIHVIDTVLLPPTDIVDTAVSAGFSTLAAAVTAADLVATLKGPGPFTVFAPTDAAFSKLPAGIVADLVKPENNQTLTRILQYHVVDSLITTNSISRLTLPANVTTLAEDSVTVSTDENNILVNNAIVVTADVFNSNGMIHAIDSVLLPPLDIVETAIVNGIFQTLFAALQAADLVATLKGDGPFTVFAPTDAAFDKLPAGTVADLLQPENVERLADILKYHVLGRSVTSGDINMLPLPAQVVTLEGGTVTVTKDGSNIKINDATVTTADVSTTNGIIHIIDTVLIPSSPPSNSTTSTPGSTSTTTSSTTPAPSSSATTPSSTTPASSSSTPAPSSTTPAPSSSTPTPSSSTPTASSSTSAPISTASTTSSTTSAPSFATPFYVNQGFFTVFLSTILFACLFSI